MTTTHTPGPWTVESDDNVDFTVIGGKSSQVRIAVECGERDARLIAAAPDLLAALQSALSDAKPAAHREYWRDGADGESSELVREETWPDWIAAARAAIARATA